MSAAVSSSDGEREELQTTKRLGATNGIAAELFKDAARTSRPRDAWRLFISDANRKPLFVIHIHSKEWAGERKVQATHLDRAFIARAPRR
jgi:hypothetical protein